MNLDAIAAFEDLDVSRMITYIRGLPNQLIQALDMGDKADVPKISDVDHIFICATGSLAIAAELLKHYLEPVCPLPVTVWRDYEIPTWAKTERTLMLVSGFTGEEKELQTCFTTGLKGGCQVVVIATGGSLISMAREVGTPHLIFEFTGPSRAALGFEFVLPLVALYKAGIIDSPRDDILVAAGLMKRLQPLIDVDSTVVENPAKRMAGQFFNRWVTLFASGFMQPVADRWKSQFHENAKAWAQVEKISDTRHSIAGGVMNPESHLTQMMTLFLHSPNDYPMDQASLEAARRIFMVEGFNTDFYRAEGTTMLENMWSAIQFGDYISYYLAMAYGVDPTPVPGVEEINSMLM